MADGDAVQSCDFVFFDRSRSLPTWCLGRVGDFGSLGSEPLNQEDKMACVRSECKELAESSTRRLKLKEKYSKAHSRWGPLTRDRQVRTLHNSFDKLAYDTAMPWLSMSRAPPLPDPPPGPARGRPENEGSRGGFATPLDTGPLGSCREGSGCFITCRQKTEI